MSSPMMIESVEPAESPLPTLVRSHSSSANQSVKHDHGQTTIEQIVRSNNGSPVHASTSHSLDQTNNQSIDQTNNQSINQITVDSNDQSNNQPIEQPLEPDYIALSFGSANLRYGFAEDFQPKVKPMVVAFRRYEQSNNQTVNQSINQSTNTSETNIIETNRSSAQPIKRAANQYVDPESLLSIEQKQSLHKYRHQQAREIEAVKNELVKRRVKPPPKPKFFSDFESVTIFNQTNNKSIKQSIDRSVFTDISNSPSVLVGSEVVNLPPWAVNHASNQSNHESVKYDVRYPIRRGRLNLRNRHKPDLVPFHRNHSIYQSINQSVNQSNARALNRSIKRQEERALRQSMNPTNDQSVEHSEDESMDESDDDLLSQANLQSNEPSINESDLDIDLIHSMSIQSIKRAISELINQAIKDLGVTKTRLSKAYVSISVPDTFSDWEFDCLTDCLIDCSINNISVNQSSFHSMMASNTPSACVVNIGAQSTSIDCLIDGSKLLDSSIDCSFGGDDLTAAMVEFIRSQSINRPINQLITQSITQPATMSNDMSNPTIQSNQRRNQTNDHFLPHILFTISVNPEAINQWHALQSIKQTINICTNREHYYQSCELIEYNVNQPTSPSDNQQADQPINQTIYNRFNVSTAGPMIGRALLNTKLIPFHLTGFPIYSRNDQPINQSIDQSINQSIKSSIDQSDMYSSFLRESIYYVYSKEYLSISRSINQLGDQSVKPIRQAWVHMGVINQPANPWPVNPSPSPTPDQSINAPLSHLLLASPSQSVNQTTDASANAEPAILLSGGRSKKRRAEAMTPTQQLLSQLGSQPPKVPTTNLSINQSINQPTNSSPPPIASLKQQKQSLNESIAQAINQRTNEANIIPGMPLKQFSNPFLYQDIDEQSDDESNEQSTEQADGSNDQSNKRVNKSSKKPSIDRSINQLLTLARPSLPQLIAASINAVSSISHRRTLCKNIILTGGTSQMLGLERELQRKLTAELPMYMPQTLEHFDARRHSYTNDGQVNVIFSPKLIDAGDMPWKGAAVIASIKKEADASSSTNQTWFTSEEWKLKGPRVLREKCTFPW